MRPQAHVRFQKQKEELRAMHRSEHQAPQGYRLPAPWGSVRFEEKEGALWAVVPELDVIDVPDPAPESISLWMQVVDTLLDHPHLMEENERKALFALPRMQALSAFSRRVLACVCDIAPGEFLTYAEVAERVGKPGAARAVGGALAANPFPILIPCHRVTTNQALSRMDILKPETLRPAAYMGEKEKSGIGAWLRLNDLADRP